MYNNENENNELDINEVTETVESEATETEVVEAVENEMTEAEEVVEEVVEAKKERQPMSKHAKFRTVSGVMTALVIVAVIIVNMLIGAMSTRVNTKIDLTAGKVLDFADETIDVVKGLEKDVTIYSLIPEQEDEILNAVDMILERYQQLSGHIKYEKVDTVKNPEFLTKYAESAAQINVYSVIFECGDKFRVVDINNAISVKQDEMTGSYQIESLSAEQKFTSALMYVVNETAVKVGIIQGHDEIPFDNYNGVVLAPENYEAVEVNLLTGTIPEDVDMIIIPSPQRDYTPDEINALDAHFDRGGKAQLIMDFNGNTLPNLEAYLAEWGVTLYNGFVVEQDNGKYMTSPNYIIPQIMESDITNAVFKSNLMLVYPMARGMKIDKVSGIENTDLLVSSDNSFVRTNLEASELTKVDGDIDGPAVISTVLSRYSTNGYAQFMIMGGTGFFEAFQSDAFANKDFYYNALASMTGGQESIYIRPKDVSPNMLAISSQQALIWAGVTVIVIPLLILIAGFVIWFKRRHL